MSSYLMHRRKAFQGGSITYTREAWGFEDSATTHPSHTFSPAPAEGNLLVGFCFNRTGATYVGNADVNDSEGSWTLIDGRDVELGDQQERHSGAWFWKTASATQPATINGDYTSNDCSLFVAEFSASIGSPTWAVATWADADSFADPKPTTVGPTASLTSKDHLIIGYGSHRNGGTVVADVTWSTETIGNVVIDNATTNTLAGSMGYKDHAGGTTVTSDLDWNVTSIETIGVIIAFTAD